MILLYPEFIKRVYDKIRNEIRSEFTNGRME